jgi:glycosyltransferase involved in cell wall biosynthesis
VINMARELTNLGNHVTVYNDCGNRAGIYDDVSYIHYEDFDILAKHDIFIGWRNPQLFDLDIDANKKYLWLHDVPQVEFYTPQIVKKIDKIFVLSQYHRSLLPTVPDDKIYVTRNGVDLTLFDVKVTTEQGKCLYSSSPDRGLDELLDMWPDIRAAVPWAELHIFYGWNCFDAMRKDDLHKRWAQKVKDAMQQDGVRYHGRVGHAELAKEMQSAAVWAYPTPFPEISCITAMKAQIAGAVPVCTTYAALNETVGYGRKIEGSIKDGNNRELFKQALIEELKNPSNVSEMQSWARSKYGWASLAKEWVSLFNSRKI